MNEFKYGLIRNEGQPFFRGDMPPMHWNCDDDPDGFDFVGKLRDDLLARSLIPFNSGSGFTTSATLDVEELERALVRIGVRKIHENPFIEAAARAGVVPGQKCTIVIPEDFRRDSRLAVWMEPGALKPFMKVSKHVHELLVFIGGYGVFSC